MASCLHPRHAPEGVPHHVPVRYVPCRERCACPSGRDSKIPPSSQEVLLCRAWSGYHIHRQARHLAKNLQIGEYPVAQGLGQIVHGRELHSRRGYEIRHLPGGVCLHPERCLAGIAPETACAVQLTLKGNTL